MSKEYQYAAQSLIDEVNRLREETEKVAVAFAEWFDKIETTSSAKDAQLLYQYFITNVYNQ